MVGWGRTICHTLLAADQIRRVREQHVTSTDCSPTPTISHQHASTWFHIFPNISNNILQYLTNMLPHVSTYFQTQDAYNSIFKYWMSIVHFGHIYILEKVNMWFKDLQFSKSYALFDKMTLLQPRQTIINTSMESFQINFHIFPLLKFSFSPQTV